MACKKSPIPRISPAVAEKADCTLSGTVMPHALLAMSIPDVEKFGG